MTLMRIRLDAPVEDLAFRFGISSSHASNTITTFIVFLSLELEPFIYWPTPEETLSYTHPHFSGDFNKCEGIGDCTEQYIEHSKNIDAQYQTYSVYKSHKTLKKLIFCTKSGSISYISQAYAGSVQTDSLQRVQMLLQSSHLILWFYLIKDSMFKISF